MASHVGTLEHRPFKFGHALLPKKPDVCVCPAVPGGHSFREPDGSRFHPAKVEARVTRGRRLPLDLATPGPLPVRHRLLPDLQDKGFVLYVALAPFTVELFAVSDLRRTPSIVKCPVGQCRHCQAPGVSRVERTQMGPNPTGGIKSRCRDRTHYIYHGPTPCDVRAVSVAPSLC